jgi:polysaccharide chain length determinant protein (PEP-CTERM system associated)
MICSWLICPIGLGYVASMPDVYQASAKVYVDTRSVLAPLLRGLAMQTDPQQEVAMMVRTLLTRPNLEIIARNSDLDITTANEAQYENLISSLARNIRLQKAGRENMYTISYRNKDPEMARTVVQETLDLFVEGSKGSSRKESDSANQFIDEQIDEYETRLLNAEQRLVNYKRKYAALLPNQGTFYGNYSTLETELEQTKLTIKETEQQIVSLAKQVSASKSKNSESSLDSPFLTTRYDSRIDSLEENLDQLMLKYTELHPTVIETNNLLDSLRASRKQEIQDHFANDDGGAPEKIGSIANELTLEISRLEGLVASLRVRESNYATKIAALKEKIDFVPQAEAERTALDRDYNITKRKYEELLNRREQSTLARKADVSSESLQFRVIDAPRTPKTASYPNRPLNYTAVLAIGFAAGLGLAFLISQLNPILIKAHQLTALTSYPVLGAVSHLNKAHILKMKRTRVLVFLLSCSVIVGIYGVLMAAEIMNINIYTRIFS